VPYGSSRVRPRHVDTARRARRISSGYRRHARRVVTVVAILGVVGVVGTAATSGGRYAPVARAAESARPSPFTVHDAHIRPATKTPTPTSHTEVVLYANISTASITLTGSGRVVAALAGSNCNGMPVVSVKVDGHVTGQVLVKNLPTYYYPAMGTAVGAGTHTVTFHMVNDRLTPQCDRNAVVSAARMEFPAAAPGSGTYGVPPGTRLTVHQGDLVIKRAGTVIDAMDIHGHIQVKANNVTIKRSIIRGGAADTHASALVAAWWGAKNLVVEDSTLRADHPNVNIDGLSGSNFTARRLDVSHVVDSVKVIGPNVSLTNSWLHQLFHSDHDPNHPDGHTHDDGIQIEGGSNIVIQGNTIADAHNAAIMITQNHSATSAVHISSNQLSGGACTVNVTQKGKGSPLTGISLAGNRFGTGTYGYACAMRLPRASSFSLSDNRWASDPTRPLVPQWF
jgi:hypothetical protein